MSNILQEQNDKFRQDVLSGPVDGGHCVVTIGVDALEQPQKKTLFKAVKEFTEFEDGDDPYGEHDFAAIEVESIPRAFFKIDYYADDSCMWGAEEPDKSCYRVMTIMLASEY